MEGKLAVFGLGIVGKWFINEMGYEMIDVIIDNNPNLWGSKWKDIDIVSLENFLKREWKPEIAITATKYEEEIIRQLENNGYKRYCHYAKIWVEKKIKKRKETIFLMNTHAYINVGDYAITEAELLFLRENFPSAAIINVSAFVCRDGLSYVKERVDASDTVLISGGGYLGNLWMECGEDNVRKIIKTFPENRIIIFPQTMYFTNDESGIFEYNISRHIYQEHKNLVMCLRDLASYELALEMTGHTSKCRNIPDIVLYMNKSGEHLERKDVVLCFREDKESILLPDTTAQIVEMLNIRHVGYSKMTMETDKIINSEQVSTVVEEKLRVVKKSKLVITDRMHCMLLCAISGTPCLAFDNISGKIAGGISWIRELPYIQLMGEEGLEFWVDKFLYEKEQYDYPENILSEKFNELADLV